jgi:hypothetical protein
MTKLSPAQYGALLSLREFGPITAIEVLGPRDMSGKRKVRLECHVMSPATLARLESWGYVNCDRDLLPRPVNAVGKLGKPRRSLCITITELGSLALGE